MSTFLDTNCLLRYLLADVEDQFETVCQHVENGACTSPEFIAECVYVLGGTVYGFDRTDASSWKAPPCLPSTKSSTNC